MKRKSSMIWIGLSVLCLSGCATKLEKQAVVDDGSPNFKCQCGEKECPPGHVDIATRAYPWPCPCTNCPNKTPIPVSMVLIEESPVSSFSPEMQKIIERDRGRYIGNAMGMIAELDGTNSVMMFSATSGQLLKWIPLQDFKEIFVDKTKPEYK